MSEDADTTRASGSGVLVALDGTAAVPGWDDIPLPARLTCHESRGCAPQPLTPRRAEEA
ncbi:MAG: hypothetical protein ACRDNW_05700 [Trebonia sp.]